MSQLPENPIINDTESLRDISLRGNSNLKESSSTELMEPRSQLIDLEVKAQQKQKRSIFTDWMRSIAIYLVVFTHINVALLRVTKGYISPVLYAAIQSYFRVVLQFGMPIFFYFSGRSSCFSKDNFLIWTFKKTTRLILPLIFGTIFIVIPTEYIALPYGDSVLKGQEMSFWEYFPLYFTKDFPSNGFEWLWFLPVLYGCSLISYPFIKLSKRIYKREETDNGINKWNIIYLFSYIAIVNLLSVVACLILSWKYYGFIMIGLACQLLILANLYFIKYYRKFHIYEAIYWPIFLCPLLLAGTQKYFTNDYAGMSGQISMFIYLDVFYIAGLIDEITYAEYTELRNTPQHLRKRPAFTFFFLIFFAICMPGIGNEVTDVGYLYAYPMYESVIVKVFYVLGTWFWIYFLVRWCQQFFDDYLDKKQYQFLMESCMVTYMVHWLFLEIGNRYFIYQHQLDYGLALFILFVWTFFCK